MTDRPENLAAVNLRRQIDHIKTEFQRLQEISDLAWRGEVSEELGAMISYSAFEIETLAGNFKISTQRHLDEQLASGQPE